MLTPPPSRSPRRSLRVVPPGAALALLWLTGCSPAAPNPRHADGAVQTQTAAAPESTSGPRPQPPSQPPSQPQDAQGASPTAAQDTASAGAAPIAVPVERGPLCVAWRDRVCQALGEYHQGCRRADEAANYLPDAACAEALKTVDAQVAYFHALRKPCEDLVAKLCADLQRDLGAEAQGTCDRIRRKTAGFGNVRCQMMRQDYATVLEEVQTLAGERRTLTDADIQAQRGGGAPHLGPTAAPIAVVFYGDFECPFCAKMADVFRGLVQRFGKEVEFVYRSYPLRMHEHAQLAAEAALAAQAQGKFWPYFDALFAHEGPLTRDALVAAARAVGLDEARFVAELDGHKWADRVAEDRRLGASVGVRKTPSFLVGSRRIFGTATFQNLSTAIEEELKERQEHQGTAQPEPSVVP